MAIRSGAETMPSWIAPVPSAQRRPELTCSYVDAAPPAAHITHITRIARFVHGDRNGWR
jgi:hypothetical protein